MTIEEIKQLVNQRIIENYTGDITAEDVNRIMTEILDNIGDQNQAVKELARKVGEKVSDAPKDNKQYARQNGAWTQVVGGSWGTAKVEGNTLYLSGAKVINNKLYL